MKKAIMILLFLGMSSAVFSDFYICYGSFRQKENALQESLSLKEVGIESSVAEVEVNGKILYRVVYAKGYADRDSAKWKLNYLIEGMKVSYPTQKDFWVFEVPGKLRFIEGCSSAKEEEKSCCEAADSVEENPSEVTPIPEEPTESPEPSTLPESELQEEPAESPEPSTLPESEFQEEPTQSPEPSTLPESELQEEPTQSPEPSTLPESELQEEPTESPEPTTLPESEFQEEPTESPEPSTLPESELPEEPTQSSEPSTLPESELQEEPTESPEDSLETPSEETPTVETAAKEVVITFVLAGQTLEKTLFDAPADVWAKIPKHATEGHENYLFTINLYRDKQRVASKTGDLMSNLNHFSIRQTFPEALFNEIDYTCEYTVELIYNGEVMATSSYLYFIG